MYGGVVVLELSLLPCLQHLNHVLPAPPFCINPLEVTEIFSLAAWPLVILFHRPVPHWNQHNSGCSAASQLIFWQTWSSKLVSFGKGMTKDLFNTIAKSIKTSEQHVSLFSPFYFPSLPQCDSRFKLLFVFFFKLPLQLPEDQRLKWLVVSVQSRCNPACIKRVVTWHEAGEWQKKYTMIWVRLILGEICREPLISTQGRLVKQHE